MCLLSVVEITASPCLLFMNMLCFREGEEQVLFFFLFPSSDFKANRNPSRQQLGVDPALTSEAVS